MLLISVSIPFQVPISVFDPSEGCWKIISWIDSKATFGDDRVHAKQMEDQYNTYVNRYGSGLVIYWFGCLTGLGKVSTNVMVLDSFPSSSAVLTLPFKKY
jgi:hypothetical protein